MKRLLFMIAVGLAVTAVSSQAQSLNAGQIQFTLDGQAVGTLLLPTVANGSTAGGYTWTLPDASGELSLGGGNPWEVGGNTLSGASELGGLTTGGHNVHLISGGIDSVRMTLFADSSVILLPNKTEMRLGDAAGNQFVGFRAPDVVDLTNGYTLIWPDSLPGGSDVRLQVDTVIGNEVFLRYTNPNTTGSIGFKGSDAETCDENQTWADVTGMEYEVKSNAIYSFEAIIEISGVDAGAQNTAVITWGTPGSNADPANTVIKYMIMDLDGTGNNQGGYGAGSEPGLTCGAGDFLNVYILKGYIQTGAIGGGGEATVQLRMRSNQTGANKKVCITAKSSVQLITE